MKPKTIVLIISIVVIFTPWLIWGQFDSSQGIKLDSKTFRMIFGLNEVHAARNQSVKFQAEYDFVFTVGVNKYLTISSSKTSALENALLLNRSWSIPNGFRLVSYQVDVVPKRISWSETSLFDDTTTYTADGFTLKANATLGVNENAELGGNTIAILLPNLQNVEQELKAKINFPNDNVRFNNKILLQTVIVHNTEIESFLASVGKWLISFIGVGLSIFSMFFMVSESSESK